MKVRGGNANNSCNVLTKLGFKASFLGSLGGGLDTTWVVDAMKKDGVVVEKCPTYPEYPCPNSVVLSSKQTGRLHFSLLSKCLQ